MASFISYTSLLYTVISYPTEFLPPAIPCALGIQLCSKTKLLSSTYHIQSSRSLCYQYILLFLFILFL